MKYTSIWVVRKLDDPNCDRVRTVVSDLHQALPNLKILESERDITPDTLIVSVGGDGTAIEAMKLSANYAAEVMCFNLGRIGFLADYQPRRLLEYVQRLHDAADSVAVEERSLIVGWTNIWEQGETATAVNDIVISRLYADEMLEYDLFVNGAYGGSHRANGVIMSTPTGSTAYALAAGGAILHPSVECIQIVPIAPATMTSRPIIVASKSTIKIKVNAKALRGESKQVVVRADGQVCALGCVDENETSHCVSISANSTKARVIHYAGWNYFDVLTEKLNWNK